MSLRFKCVAVTHIGNRRKNNEDSFFIGELLTFEEQKSMSQLKNRCIQKQHVTERESNQLYAVSDGLGGHNNGEYASSMVTAALENFINMQPQKALRRDSDKFCCIQSFQKLVRELNRQMLNAGEGEDDADSMGATLSGLFIFGKEAVIFNIGDSSVFLFQDDTLEKLTTDDNEATRLDAGMPGRMEKGSKRLIKYLGISLSHGILTASISKPIPLCAGQKFILATDGLTDCLSGKQILEIIKKSETLEKSTMNLMQAALNQNGGGRDNITVAVLEIEKRYKWRRS